MDVDKIIPKGEIIYFTITIIKWEKEKIFNLMKALTNFNPKNY